jgi:hypothetical protein
MLPFSSWYSKRTNSKSSVQSVAQPVSTSPVSLNHCCILLILICTTQQGPTFASKRKRTSFISTGAAPKVHHWLEVSCSFDLRSNAIIRYDSRFDSISKQVFCTDTDRWVSVDFVNQSLDDPQATEAHAPKPLRYAIAVDNDGFVKDVTQRFVGSQQFQVSFNRYLCS